MNKHSPYFQITDGIFPQFKQLVKNPIHFLAFGLGSGLSPKAPGTAGTLAAIPFYLLVYKLPILYYGLFVAITFLIGVYLCDKTSKDLRVHDHSGIVWDEMVGFWITMMAIPISWQSIVAGFLLFRLFDIWKPFPIKLLDRHVNGGFGVMIDDVVAAFFAWFCLYFWYFVHSATTTTTQ